MEVNFNNLRKQACFSYSRICKKLNSSITDSGEILLQASELQQDMDDLRHQLLHIAACYQDNDDNVKDVGGEVGEIPVFNEEKN